MSTKNKKNNRLPLVFILSFLTVIGIGVTVFSTLQKTELNSHAANGYNCAKDPTLTAKSSQNNKGNVVYYFTLKNNDRHNPNVRSQCEPDVYSVYTKPYNWLSSLIGRNKVTVSEGEEVSFGYKVNRPDDVGNGEYPVIVKAINNRNESSNAAEELNYRATTDLDYACLKNPTWKWVSRTINDQSKINTIQLRLTNNCEAANTFNLSGHTLERDGFISWKFVNNNWNEPISMKVPGNSTVLVYVYAKINPDAISMFRDVLNVVGVPNLSGGGANMFVKAELKFSPQKNNTQSFTIVK